VTRTLLSAVLPGLLVAAFAAPVSAQGLGPVHRFSAEFQFSPPADPEIFTTAAPSDVPVPGSGGTTVYSKTLFIPYRTLFVTFSGTGDVHNTAGAPDNALLMTCVVDGVVCNSGSGLIGAGPAGWITLLKMPPLIGDPSGCSAGVGDGGGGGGDCHDNSITYTWCTTVAAPGVHTVELKLAAANGTDFVFYERGHIYIDATPNKNADDNCVAAAVGPFTGTLP